MEIDYKFLIAQRIKLPSLKGSREWIRKKCEEVSEVKKFRAQITITKELEKLAAQMKSVSKKSNEKRNENANENEMKTQW